MRITFFKSKPKQPKHVRQMLDSDAAVQAKRAQLASHLESLVMQRTVTTPIAHTPGNRNRTYANYFTRAAV